MAGANGIIKDVELTKEGVLYGQVYTPQGQKVPNAVVQLRYQGTAVAAARSNEHGQFAISGVRGGAHEIVVGPLRKPVRLWANGAAPRNATKGMVVAIDETIVRGQDVYCEPGAECAPTSGFGMLDVITLEPELEQLLVQAKTQGTDEAPMLEPGMADRLQTSLASAAERQEIAGKPSVLLVSSSIRALLARFVRASQRVIHVLAYEEIPDNKQITVVATVGRGG